MTSRFDKRPLPAAVVALASVLVAMLLAIAVPASAEEPLDLVSPFPADQTWHVCQGYHTSISHKGNGRHSFDLVLDSTDVGYGYGCTTGKSPTFGNGSNGASVLAPGDGVIVWDGTDKRGSVCIDLDVGGSVMLAHLNTAVSGGHGDRVKAGETELGTVATKGAKYNGGVAHIHLQGFGSESCSGSSVPFSSANDLNICGISYPDLGANVEHQYWGTEIQGCGVSTGGPSEIAIQYAVGDFNGDGVDDLATGLPDESVSGKEGAGVVRIAYGGAGSDRLFGYTDHILSQDSPGISWGPEVGDAFGAALSSGDFNGDGVDDLAVGVVGETFDGVDRAGLIHIFWGSIRSPLSGEMIQTITQDTPGVSGGPEAGDRFGSVLASGDLNGDGVDDLVVGVPEEDLGSVRDAGVIYLFYGQAGSSLSGSREHSLNQDSSGVSNGVEADDRFGSALSAGDFNGDGVDDLAVGVSEEDLPNGDFDAGMIHVFYGRSGADLSGYREQALNQDSPGVAGGTESGDRFGFALAAGDFNGDGADDLSVGVPEEHLDNPAGVDLPSAGMVHVFYGLAGAELSGSGSREWAFDQLTADISGDREAGDRLGYILASGDFNGDGVDDLVAGTPFEDLGSDRDAGAIHVLYGRSGLSLVGSREHSLHQDSPDVGGGPEDDDRFGAPLAAGDFNRDGIDDLAVGVTGEVVSGVHRPGTTQVFRGQQGVNLHGSRESALGLQNGAPPNPGQDDCSNVGPLPFSGYSDRSQVMLYRETDGTRYLFDFASDGSMEKVWGPERWSPGWDQIVAVEADATPGAELFLYNAVTGKRYLYDISDSGALSKIWGPVDWGKGWELVPLEIDNTVGSELLVYRKTDGSRYLLDFATDGSFTTIWGPESWAPGWDQVVTVESDQTAGSELFLYNSVTGARHLLDIAESGAVSNVWGPLNWNPGWKLTPIESDNTVGSELLLYNEQHGGRYILDFEADGSLTTLSGRQDWAKGWDQMVTVEADGSPGSELYIYNSATGRQVVVDFAESGDTSNIFGPTTWATGWCLIPIEHPLPPVEPPPADRVVSVVSKTVTESERNQVVRVTLELSEPADATTRVRYTTVDGTATRVDDYVRRSGIVTFPRGQTTKTASVTIRGDSDFEPTETFGIELSQPTGLVLGENGVVTIEDNDPENPPLPVVDVISQTVVETDRNQVVRVTLQLSEPAAGTTRVRYTATDGTATSADDYVRRSGIVTFPRGQTTKTASVTIRGDSDFEPTETFGIELSQPTGLVLGDNGVVTIEDNDPENPQLPVVDVISQTVVETDRNQTIRVTFELSEPAAKTTRVRYTTVAGSATKNSDYTHRSGLVTFPRGKTSRTANVVIRGGTTAEPTESFEIVLSQPTGLELGSNATITIEDND